MIVRRMRVAACMVVINVDDVLIGRFFNKLMSSIRERWEKLAHLNTKGDEM